MSPRYPRPATPTVPPPAELLVKRLDTWKTFVAIAVGLLATGGAAYSVAASKADVGELHQVRDGAAAALSAAQAGTSAQLDALQATVQDLRTHQAALDASLNALTGDVAQLNGTANQLYLQLVEIARATGARQVSATATSSRTTTPPTRPP